MVKYNGIFVSIIFFTSFGMYLTPKLSKYVTLIPATYKTFERVLIDLHSSRFIIYASSFTLGKLFLE